LTSNIELSMEVVKRNGDLTIFKNYNHQCSIT